MIIDCSGSVFGVIVGSGNLVTKDLESIYRDYTKIISGPSCKLELIPSENGEYSGTITADDNIIDTYRVTKLEGDELTIGLKPLYTYSNVTFYVRITIPINALYGLKLYGSSKGKINSRFNHNHSFGVDISGASTLLIEDLHIRNIIFNVSGASEVNINGDVSSEKVELDISGASKVNINGLASSEKAKLSVTGESSIIGNFNVSEDAIFNIEGASNINLIGNNSTDVSTFNVNGASNANLEKFKVLEANVDISGASIVRIYAENSIKGRLSGASILYYKGTNNIDVNVSGSSHLTPID